MSGSSARPIRSVVWARSPNDINSAAAVIARRKIFIALIPLFSRLPVVSRLYQPRHGLHLPCPAEGGHQFFKRRREPSDGTIALGGRQFRVRWQAVAWPRCPRAVAAPRCGSVRSHRGSGYGRAARRRIERARHLALQHMRLRFARGLAPGSPTAARGLGMARRGEQGLRSGSLDDGAEIHHGDAVGDGFTTARSCETKI